MTDRLLTAREVYEALGICRAAFYKLAYFRTRKFYPTGSRAVRYSEADVRFYQEHVITRRVA